MSTRELSSWERVTTEIVHFIQARHIDSFQKLRILIFFHEHLESSWTSSQIVERLYFGDELLLEEIMADLQAVGLVENGRPGTSAMCQPYSVLNGLEISPGFNA